MITRPKRRVWAIAAVCFLVLPLMAQTTFSEERDIAEARRLGARRFLVKPPTSEMLTDVLASLEK